MSNRSMKIQIGARTDVGRQRQHNEDNYVVCPDLKEDQWFFDNRKPIDVGNLGSLLVVADGMGGTNAGEVASELAIEAIKDYFSKNLSNSDTGSQFSIRTFLKKAILTAQDRIVNHQQENPSTVGMGTTIVMVWLLGSEAHVAWVGDSRCYRFDQERLLDSLSKDHSYVQELVDKGEINEEQAFYHPDGNIISQSLGDPEMSPQPSLAHFPIEEGQKIMLCSDGLNSMLKDEEIQSVFTSESNVNSCTGRLVELANEAGGYDNITVVMTEIMKTSGPPVKAFPFNKFGLFTAIIALLVLFVMGWFAINQIEGIPYSPFPVVDSIKMKTQIEGQGEIIQIIPGDTLYVQSNSSGLDTFLKENGEYIPVKLLPESSDIVDNEDPIIESNDLEHIENDSNPDSLIGDRETSEQSAGDSTKQDTVMNIQWENTLLEDLKNNLLQINNKSKTLITDANDHKLAELQNAVSLLLARCDQIIEAESDLQSDDYGEICKEIERIMVAESEVKLMAGNQKLTAEMAELKEIGKDICMNGSASP